MNSEKQGFTLVELVVVISIIWILAAIWIISYMWYGEKSRDSVRLADLWSIENLLELYKIDYAQLPIPTDAIAVNYSGALVWAQWYFWENIAQKVKNKWSYFLDPETQKPYSYSIANNLEEYQIWTILESNDVAMISNQTYASDNVVRGYLQWNYNAKAIRTQTWGINYILATPSITTSRFWENGDFIDIINNNWITYHKTQNLPYAYRNTKFKLLWGQTSVYHISNENVDIYQTNNIKEVLDNTSQGQDIRISILQNVQNAYANTVVAKNIQRYMSANTQNPDNYTKTVSDELIYELFNNRIISDQGLFAFVPFDWDWLLDDGTPASGWWNNQPAPVYNSDYNISFNKPNGETYTCTTCN